MPLPLVKKLAEQKGVDLPEAEKRWENAKKIAEEQADLTEETDGEDFWKYVVGVFNKSMGVGEDDISENANVQLWDKDRPAVAYPQRVREATTFSEIVHIFSSLFPFAVDHQSWEQEYADARKYRELLDELRVESEFEVQYEIAQEIMELATSNRFKNSFKTMAGPRRESLNLSAFADSAVGAFLLTRNCEDGERIAEAAVPGFKERMREHSEIQAWIKQIQKDYDVSIVGMSQKRIDEVNAARASSGARVLEDKMKTLESEHWARIRLHSQNIPPSRDTEAFAKWNQQSDEYNRKFHEQFNALEDQVREIEKLHVQPVREKWMVAMRAASEKRENDIRDLKRESQTIGAAIISKIMESSPVTKEEADRWAKSQKVGKSAILRLKKQGYLESDLREHMAEFYRLTGGRIGKAFIETKGDRRANAVFWNGVINIDGHFTKKTLFHEMGHLLEREPKFVAMSEAFRDGRAKKEKGTRSLRSITKNRGYRSNEVAYTDDFFHPYIGKVYRYRATEVISMGMQMFGDPEDTVFLAERDPQMFNMMLGFMSSRPTARELSHKKKIEETAVDTTTEQERLDKFYQALAKKAKDDSFWERNGSGLISRIEVLRGGRSGRTMVLYLHPGDPNEGPQAYLKSCVFKTRQDARNFAYLYLLYVQKGIIADKKDADRLVLGIAFTVQRKTMPPNLKIDDLPAFIEDLK